MHMLVGLFFPAACFKEPRLRAGEIKMEFAFESRHKGRERERERDGGERKREVGGGGYCTDGRWEFSLFFKVLGDFFGPKRSNFAKKSCWNINCLSVFIFFKDTLIVVI